jgi:hypothetical protein
MVAFLLVDKPSFAFSFFICLRADYSCLSDLLRSYIPVIGILNIEDFKLPSAL